MKSSVFRFLFFSASIGLAQAALADGSERDFSHNRFYSLQVASPGLTDRYLRHASSFARTESVSASSPEGLKLDATFKVVRGLADGNCLSFESRNFPGQYLRHRDFRIRIDISDGSPLFRADATFCPRAALDGSDNVSFESKNVSGHYIRHRNAEVWLDRKEENELYSQDATWQAAPAWWKSEVSLTNHTLRSLRVARPNFADRFIRHYDGWGFTAAVSMGSDSVLKADATFRILPGLADNSCYSFESLNFPGQYLRHSAFRIRKDPRDGSQVFDQDATFCAVPGLSGYGVSLWSLNFPDRFLRHAFGELWISKAGERVPGESAHSFAEDASWDIMSPWWH